MTILRQCPVKFVLAGVFLALLLVAPAAQATSTDDFVHEADIAGQFEISSSRLALQNSQNDAIKAFAQQMIDDHTKAANDLKTAVSTLNISPSQPAPSEDGLTQKKLDKLSKLSGTDFDNAYVKMQLSAHNDAVKLFSNYSKTGTPGPVRDFAQATLPILKEHLAHIKKIKASR